MVILLAETLISPVTRWNSASGPEVGKNQFDGFGVRNISWQWALLDLMLFFLLLLLEAYCLHLLSLGKSWSQCQSRLMAGLQMTAVESGLRSEQHRASHLMIAFWQLCFDKSWGGGMGKSSLFILYRVISFSPFPWKNELMKYSNWISMFLSPGSFLT